MQRRDLLNYLATAGLGALFAPAKLAFAAPPVHLGPTVTGPVTGGKHGRPFGAYVGDIAALGYVEEEYFLAGEATRYEPVGALTPDGKWTLTPAGTRPYKTRILVRRPRDPARFNGTVILEWLNVSFGHELSTIGRGPFDGFAVVSVSNQYVGVNGLEKKPMGLKAWDPDRYASLSLPAESLSYDIFTQAARAVGPHRTRGVDPMGGLRVTKVIATGASQSGIKLLSYINGVQPLANVIDAIVPTVGFGLAAGFGDAVFDMSDPASGRLFFGPISVRGDLRIPVMVVNSENETTTYYPARQPDTAKFVYWEVAGATHGPAPEQRAFLLGFKRDGLDETVAATSKGLEAHPSEVSWVPSVKAALTHVHRWINGGPPPPSMPKIEVEPGTPPRIVRDRYGIAVGGVRLPEVEVPIARNGVPANASPLTMNGVHEPFTREQIHSLYPSKADYVAKVTAAARAAERAGVIPAWRTTEYIREAEAANI